ncbi:MAG: metal-dependent hydrolase [Oleiphilaceae bacterium]|nr:metal-dependent hydrolase [Oleiphilaceae bacterium]
MYRTDSNYAPLNDGKHFQPDMDVREKLDFGLDETIPKYWLDGNPFRTRLMDAMQVTFPDGERYFITAVRAFRDQIEDPTQLEDVKAFTRQEAQHGIAHTKFNNLLKKQGMPIDEILSEHKEIIDKYLNEYSPEYNVALTAAFEHFTALMAEAFFSKKYVSEGFDHRMKTMFAWHAIEEMEHRSVAFDVMQKVAKVGYFMRVWAVIYGTYETMRIMFTNGDKLLKADGFSKWERRKMFIKNLPWMYGRKGVFSSFTKPLFAYLKPGFHPEKIPVVHNYPAWVEEYNKSGDPAKACDALLAAAH